MVVWFIVPSKQQSEVASETTTGSSPNDSKRSSPAVTERVYFVGSHSTGKTTMCRWVHHRYDLPIITEVARAVLAEMERDLDELRTNIELVYQYQRQVFERQVAAEKSLSAFVSDRAFDNIAYAAEHSTAAPDILQSAQFADYMKWVADGTVFFLRPHRTLQAVDGVRERQDWEASVRIDGMIKLLLESYRIPYLPIASPSMQERTRAVDFVLRGMR